MKKIIIEGGRPLCGTVAVSGAKNAALPVLFATLLVSGRCAIENLPDIGDVALSLDILRRLGADVRRIHKNGYVIDCSAARGVTAACEEVRGIRGSVYLLGAGLGRFGEAECLLPGGCALGLRPIDQHLLAFRAMGATVTEEKDRIHLRADRLVGTDITFETVSVGATVNAILAATGAEGVTRLFGASKEPHVTDLIRFLGACGACITGGGTDCIRIVGGRPLHGVVHRLIPDMIEAGTYLMAGIMSGGSVTTTDVAPAHLQGVISVLKQAGADITETADTVTATATGSLLGLRLETGPYPAFPTDLHPQLAALLATAQGPSCIEETIWPDRFRYADELWQAGLCIRRNGNCAEIAGGNIPRPAVMQATDLRAGAAEMIAALGAKGLSVIEGAEMIARGYEDPVEKLRLLGAQIHAEA